MEEMDIVSRTQTSDTNSPPALVPLMEVDLPVQLDTPPQPTSPLAHPVVGQAQKPPPNSITISALGNILAFTVSTPDSMNMCGVCGDLADEPHICGNTDICSAIFCEPCLSSHLVSNSNCPTCNYVVLGGKAKGSLAQKKAVGKLLIHCPHSARNTEEQNKENGAVQAGSSSGKKRSAQDCHECPWTGPLSSLGTHLSKECQEEPEPCIHPGCGQQVPRREKEQHAQDCSCRPVECEYCETNVQHQAMTNHYLKECKKMPDRCDLCGNDDLTREKMPRHIEFDCPWTMMSCPYKSLGCCHDYLRKEEETHLRDFNENHLR